MRRKLLISAGEASGDLYASLVVNELRRLQPDLDLFGCTGPRLRSAGVRTVVDSASLAVVGLLEVVSHIPRIYGEYRRLIQTADHERPELAILTDSPDFHLRIAKQLARRNVPVVYLVAPQVWAWRKGRLPIMRRTLACLLCIFPFEEEFFQKAGLTAKYIGHPLAGLIRPSLTKDAFFRKHGLDPNRPLISVLPGSRRGESARHIPALLDAVDRIDRVQPANWVLPASATAGQGFFRERIADPRIRIIEGESWDAMAHSELALAASGTVTVEAALLGTPTVTYYRVSPLTWMLGRRFVNVPFFSMVNLIAGRAIIPELIQGGMTGENIAAEALKLLTDRAAMAEMKRGLEEVREKLSGSFDTPARAAAIINKILEGNFANVS